MKQLATLIQKKIQNSYLSFRKSLALCRISLQSRVFTTVSKEVALEKYSGNSAIPYLARICINAYICTYVYSHGPLAKNAYTDINHFCSIENTHVYTYMCMCTGQRSQSTKMHKNA